MNDNLTQDFSLNEFFTRSLQEMEIIIPVETT